MTLAQGLVDAITILLVGRVGLAVALAALRAVQKAVNQA